MLKPLDTDTAKRVHDLFRSAGYSRAGMRKALVANELPSRNLRNLPRLLYQTREPGTLNTLLRLFAFGLRTAKVEVEKMLPSWFLDAALRCGLIEIRGQHVESVAMLAPFEGLLVATDHSRKIESAEDPNVVLIINPTTWLLYRSAIRRPARATLDLGAGCGALALTAAAYSEQVAATDLNPRCTEFARFNAALNLKSNVECLTGSLFDPVAGRKFDAIVTNPPFFITPVMDHLFCDNEMELDGFCRKLVRLAPDYLNEGGFLQMICEWVEIERQSWKERLSEWVADSGCDALVLKGHTELPDRYATNRIRETTPPSPAADARNYSSWTGYYRKKGVTAIHRGIINLRRRSGRNWLSFEDAQRLPKRPFGNAILRRFDIQDLLNREDSEAALLNSRLQVTPGAKLIRRMKPSREGWTLEGVKLSQNNDIPHEQNAGGVIAEYLALFDGKRTAAEAMDQLVDKVGAPRERVREECINVTRRLLERGFLSPPEAEAC